jgi:hypothetical protein
MRQSALIDSSQPKSALDGICPPNEASLTFPREAVTLVLRIGTAARA